MSVDVFAEVVGAHRQEAERAADRPFELPKNKLGGMTGKSSTELSANVAQAAKMRSLVGKEQEQPRRSDSPQCQYEMRRAHDERRSLANPHDMGGDDTVAS